MSDSGHSDVVKSGSLYLKWKRLYDGASKTCEEWTKRWVVLRKQSSRGVARLEHFEKVEDVNESKSKEVISLVGVCEVTKGFHMMNKDVFEIKYSATHTRCHSLLCGTSNETDTCEWQASIASFVSSRIVRQQRVLQRGSDDMDDHTRPVTTKLQDDTDMYRCKAAVCTLMKETQDSEIFRVTIEPTECSNTLKLHGNYILLIVDNSRLVLSPLSPTQAGIEWDLTHIRNFKSLGGNTLVITTGRRSSTGLGTFRFLTKRADCAFTKLNRKTHKLVAQQQRTAQRQSLEETCKDQLLPQSIPPPSGDAPDLYDEVINEIYDSF